MDLQLRCWDYYPSLCFTAGLQKRLKTKKNVHFHLFSAHIFNLCSVNSNSDSHVNCTNHVELQLSFWDYYPLLCFTPDNKKEKRAFLFVFRSYFLRYVEIFHTRLGTAVITPKTHFLLFSYKIEFFVTFI